MSNEIYPLEEWEYIRRNNGNEGCRRTVNQRLAPIFRVLADDPDGWSMQAYNIMSDRQWATVDFLPHTHQTCDDFRLTPKRKTISVEIPVPDELDVRLGTFGPKEKVVSLRYSSGEDGDKALETIRSAMEGK